MKKPRKLSDLELTQARKARSLKKLRLVEAEKGYAAGWADEVWAIYKGKAPVEAKPEKAPKRKRGILRIATAAPSDPAPTKYEPPPTITRTVARLSLAGTDTATNTVLVMTLLNKLRKGGALVVTLEGGTLEVSLMEPASSNFGTFMRGVLDELMEPGETPIPAEAMF